MISPVSIRPRPAGITNDASTNGNFLRDVLQGLSAAQKTLPCKYLYDQRGSQLFDQICELEEYYVTRAELEIMETHAESIANQIGPSVKLVEYGSGSSVKTRILLDSLDQPVAYVPVDISRTHLLRTANDLQTTYPNIEILPVVADFTQHFKLPRSTRPASHVALYFPGSTIGNFTPADAGRLLQGMSNMLGDQGGLLIGIDLQKERSVIEAAYDDAHGVTADFNLNLLHRINRELEGSFDVDRFEHKAIYNSDAHRVEISMVSLCDQQVQIAGSTIAFRSGEEILSEYSHKYTIDGFATFASKYGFALHHAWTDNRDYFAVLHLVLEE